MANSKAFSPGWRLLTSAGAGVLVGLGLYAANPQKQTFSTTLLIAIGTSLTGGAAYYGMGKLKPGNSLEEDFDSFDTYSGPPTYQLDPTQMQGLLNEIQAMQARNYTTHAQAQELVLPPTSGGLDLNTSTQFNPTNNGHAHKEQGVSIPLNELQLPAPAQKREPDVWDD